MNNDRLKPADVSKRGLMGTIKAGSLSSRQKRAESILYFRNIGF